MIFIAVMNFFAKLSILFLLVFPCQSIYAQEVFEFMDLQIHPTMHIPYRFWGKNLQFFKKEPKLSYKHLLTNVNYAQYFVKNKGCRIFVVGHLAHENTWTQKKAKHLILKQINFITDFVEKNDSSFAIAKNPEEVRKLVHETQKTIFIHSIEGGNKLVNSQKDADFWAEQGVAFITLIHLVDSDLGTSAIAPTFITRLINWKGHLKSEKKRGGLTEKGKNAIKWLANAGILTDITHMSDSSRADAINLMESENIPLISTHDGFKPIQNHCRAISEEHILRIYKAGGFVSLAVSVDEYNPEAWVQAKIDSLKQLKCHCEGSIDSYVFTYKILREFIDNHSIELTSKPLNDLQNQDKIKLSIGFQTDFNGWTNHSRPRVGKKGCYEIDKKLRYEDVEIKGLVHPGMMASHWTFVEKQGVDLQDFKRNTERFLQLWEKIRNH